MLPLHLETHRPFRRVATADGSRGFQPSDLGNKAKRVASRHRNPLRGNPGEDCDVNDSIVVDTHAPGDTLTFDTTFSLTQAGPRIGLKVYVVPTIGNEAGSATMTVQRPF